MIFVVLGGARLAAERGSARALAEERGVAKWRGRGLGQHNTNLRLTELNILKRRKISNQVFWNVFWNMPFIIYKEDFSINILRTYCVR